MFREVARVDAGSGCVYDLTTLDGVAMAIHDGASELKKLPAGITQAEIERLQGLPRAERRAALKGLPKVERDELKALLFSPNNKPSSQPKDSSEREG